MFVPLVVAVSQSQGWTMVGFDSTIFGSGDWCRGYISLNAETILDWANGQKTPEWSQCLGVWNPPQTFDTTLLDHKGLANAVLFKLMLTASATKQEVEEALKKTQLTAVQGLYFQALEV